jgi:hypothetical protein
LYTSLQKLEENETPPNSFYEPSTNLILKPDRWCTKENYRTVTLININVKVLNKITENRIQQYGKTITLPDQGGFIPQGQGRFKM